MVRRVGAFAAIVAVSAVTTAAAGPLVTPRFSFSASVVTPGDDVTVRLTRSPQPFKQPIRVYLVAESAAATVRSRFDSRLTFVGSAVRTRRAVTFTVPPLEPGLYTVAYWCRGCMPRGKNLVALPLPLLRIDAASSGKCPVTIPNGTNPPGAQPSSYLHGGGGLWAFLPIDGVFSTREVDGTSFQKMIWLGTGPGGRTLLVRYERVETADPPLRADTIAGQLSGYTGESWASRMHFKLGCWKVTGRVGDASLAFVVEVVQA
jgi:hypothetical protein